MLELRANSLAETHAIAAAVASLARPGDVIILSGEMGAGKTAFAQGFGRAMGVNEPITSPTFTLVHSYDCGKVTLHHADLYRLERTSEVADLALAELAEFHGIVLVEWGEVVESTFADHLVVALRRDADLEASPDDVLDDIADGVDADRDSADRGDATDRGDDADDGARDPGDDRADDDWIEDSSVRLIDLAGVGPSWAARWDRLTEATEVFRC